MTSPDHAPRGRDSSRALTEIRTVLSRARSARQVLGWPTTEDFDPTTATYRSADPDAADMRDALDQVIALLSRWQRTGRTPRKDRTR